MLAILQREPLAYEIVGQRGSHRTLWSRRGHPPLAFSFHDRATLSPAAVRQILVRDVGLAPDEARRLL